MLTIGPDAFRERLAAYWREAPPAPFASDEADGFAAHLERDLPAAPYLAEVVAFERAVLATLADGAVRTTPFSVDPLPLLRSIADRRLPDDELVFPGNFEVEVTPDQHTADEAAEMAAPLLMH